MGVVDLIEPLIRWQGAPAARYTLPGVGAGRDVLEFGRRRIARSHQQSEERVDPRVLGNRHAIDRGLVKHDQ